MKMIHPNVRSLPVSPRILKSRGQFLSWLRARHPEVYDRANGGMSGFAGLGAENAAPADQKDWIDRLTGMLPNLATTYAQVKLINANLKRAESGLPPLDTSSTAAQVKVGPSDEAKRYLNYALWGGGALAAILIVRPMLARR